MLKKAIPILIMSIIIAGAGILTGVMWKGSETGNGDTEASDETGSDKNENNAEDSSLISDIDLSLVLSEFTTTGDNDAARNTNLKAACDKINKTVLSSGEEFSFNEAIGPCTTENGYVEAKILLNGVDTTSDVGGGVCQVATTLYNAALKGNITVLESHRHSAPVTYVPVGMDAAVEEGVLDLRISNPYDCPVMIEAVCEESTVTVRFLGMELPDGGSVDVESYVTEQIESGGTVYQYTDELPDGEERMVQEGHQGYISESYKVIYDSNGNETGRELISRDEYPAVAPVIEVGRSDYNK